MYACICEYLRHITVTNSVSVFDDFVSLADLQTRDK